jgi:hypothetical protein
MCLARASRLFLTRTRVCLAGEWVSLGFFLRDDSMVQRGMAIMK